MNTNISIRNILKGLGTCGLIALLAYSIWTVPFLNPIKLKMLGKKTVANRVSEFEDSARKNLESLFAKQNAPFLSDDIVLVFIKSKRTLSLYARSITSEFKLIKSYPVLAASGKSGPKLKDGDYQVPEGIYRIESLNPNSAYHLSLRLNYPNAFDLARAREDGRDKLGSDIMIHGNKVSIGCIAIGNAAIEEIFVLAAKSDYTKWKVISAPVDFRLGEVAPPPRQQVAWLQSLYKEISFELTALPLP